MTIKGKKYKLVFRPGRTLTKVVLLVTIALCIAALITIQSSINREKARLEKNKAAAFQLEQEQKDVQGKIDRLGSQDSIVEIAGEELGLHDPNTVIVETE